MGCRQSLQAAQIVTIKYNLQLEVQSYCKIQKNGWIAMSPESWAVLGHEFTSGLGHCSDIQHHSNSQMRNSTSEIRQNRLLLEGLKRTKCSPVQ